MPAVLRSIVLTSALCLLAILSPAAQAQSQALYQFDLPEQPLADALRAIARQTGANVLFESKDLRNIRAPALQAELTTAEAIERVLAGTNLEAERTTPTTVVIQPKVRQSSVGHESLSQVSLRLAQDAGPQNPHEEKPAAARENKGHSEQEVVVTGTQIRGTTSIASPVTVVSREEIDRSGTGSIQRFIQNLPENFKGGASEGTFISSGGGGTAVNTVSGTAFNLRGLGNDSTLTLLDGRRFAPNNYAGNFVDVSMIPLAAVERIEIMPDGASALYGSDAVGGVVNMIMKKDFQGVEARARYAGTTQGGLREKSVGLTGGTAWNSGSALLSYEYFQQDPLDMNDKDWSPKFNQPNHAVGAIRRHGVFSSVRQSLGERLEVFGSGLYSDKRVPENLLGTPNSNIVNYSSSSKAYDLTAGMRLGFAQDQEVELLSSFGESNANYKAYQAAPITAPMVLAGNTVGKTGILSADLKLSGPLAQLPAGKVAYAFGLHARDERFRQVNQITRVVNIDIDRKAWATFGELRVPLIGSSRERPLLEASLAGRYEKYNDYGDSVDPKVGLILTPVRDFRLRGTWGTSFKAPLLKDLNPVHSQTAVTRIIDPLVDPTGVNTVPVAFVYGGEPNLVPETATSWTVGFDWTPHELPFKAKVTYYNIAYEDRITNPQLAFGGVVPNTNRDPLVYESLLSRFITRNPTVAALQALIANSSRFDDFTNIPGGVNLANVRAIVDYRIANLSAVDTSGIDFSFSTTHDLGSYGLTAGIDGTYILSFDNLLAPGTPVIQGYNSVFSPVDLKLRGRVGLAARKWTSTLYINHVDSYDDRRNVNNIVPVSAWTTLDLNFMYSLGDAVGILSGMDFSLGATNLTDKAPPYVRPTSTLDTFLVFDGANHDLRGRVAYFELSKRF